MSRKVVYIAGPISGVDNYEENFARYEKDLTAMDYIVLNPARLPEGLTEAQYMRIDFAMIDAADAVFFLPGWECSPGAKLELAYCAYTGKEVL